MKLENKMPKDIEKVNQLIDSFLNDYCLFINAVSKTIELRYKKNEDTKNYKQ